MEIPPVRCLNQVRMRLVLRSLLWIGVFALLQELVLRAVFPLPEVSDFDRGSYSHLGVTPDATPGAERRSSLGHRSFTWASDPDGFETVHALNLYGFRDREWSLAKPPGATRVAFIGDSFVEGFSVPVEDSIPAVFRGLAGERVDVLNLGVGGADLPTYARLLRDALPLFHPDAVVLVLFANDILPTRFEAEWLEDARAPQYTSPWTPRLVYVVRRLRAGLWTPRRWIEPPFPFLPAVPDPRNPWSDGRTAGRLEAFVAADVARAIRAGRFNPVLVDYLPWFRRQLVRELSIAEHLAAFARKAASLGASLRVVYIPTKNQVSDRYLAAEARFSPPGSVGSLLGERFQVQARILAQSCADNDLPFLDLTPALREREVAAGPLYWDYDDHMRPVGYRAAAELIHTWWSP